MVLLVVIEQAHVRGADSLRLLRLGDSQSIPNAHISSAENDSYEEYVREILPQ